VSEQETIFYSWQSDLPNKTNRGFIEEALRKATEAVHKSKVFGVELVVDRDTKGSPGSPDISATILKKIEAASVFVADVSIVTRSGEGRPCPNPNVLLELGYAWRALGEENVIIVYNLSFGALADLPFDLRGKRIASYRLSSDEQPAAEKQRLIRIIEGALEEIAAHRNLNANYQRNSEFASELTSELIRVQIYGNEVGKRRIDPWSSRISNVYEKVSHWLTDHSHEAVAEDLGLRGPMEGLVLLLDSVRSHAHVLGGGAKFTEKVMAATQAAATLQGRVDEKGPLTDEGQLAVISVLADQQKRLAAWVTRIREVDLYNSGRYGDFIDAVVEAGFQLTYTSYFPLDWLQGVSARDIREIGETLHLIDLTSQMNKHKGREGIVNLVDQNESKLRALLQDANLSVKGS
jgi:hypothetical protein